MKGVGLSRNTLATLGLLLVAAVGTAAGSLQVEAVHTSTNKVTCMLATEDSVWVGTRGGCIRWDEKSDAGIKYTTLNGLPGNVVTAITGGPKPGTVLIATTRGVQGFADRRGPLQPVTPLMLRDRYVTDMIGSPEGTYAVVGRRIFHLSADGEYVFNAVGEEVSSPIRCLAWHQGTLIAGFRRGLYERQDDSWRPIVHAEKTLALVINDLLSSGDTLYVATAGGLYVKGPDGWRSYTVGDDLPDNHITSLSHGAGGVIAGIFGGGAMVVGPDGVEALKGSSGYVTAAAVRPGRSRVWIGTNENGTWLHENGECGRVLRRTEIPGNSITGIAVADKDIHAGTFYQGVGILHNGQWRSIAPPGTVGTWINHLAHARGRLWVRTSAGLVHSYHGGKFELVAGASGKVKQWTSGVWSVGDTVWLGLWGALAKFDGRDWTITSRDPSLRGQVITAVAVFDKKLWVGTAKDGLKCHDPAMGTWETVSLGSGLSDTWVTALDVYDDALWVGTFNGGLCRYSGDAWEALRAPDALPSARVNCLAHSADALYVGTLDGLAIRQSGQWETFTRDEGLPSEVVQALAVDPATGDVWVGTSEGLARMTEQTPGSMR